MMAGGKREVSLIADRRRGEPLKGNKHLVKTKKKGERVRAGLHFSTRVG